MRKPPTAELVEVKPKDNQERVTQVRRYRLITPLFGGGVQPKAADPIKAIRETGIRGQLRFWWRATRGTGTLAEMKQREGALWGSAGAGDSLPSKVSVVVKIENEGTPDEPFELNVRDKPQPRKGSLAPAYAAFPLQPTDEEVRRRQHLPMKQVRVGVKFALTISFPDASLGEVESALWAWEYFGGVGGRTRRGFGAIQLLAVDSLEVEPLKAHEAEQKIKEKLAQVCLAGTWNGNENTPHLLATSEMALTKSKRNCLEVWQYLIEELQNFRQSPRKPSKKLFSGESDWSEPDAIRSIVGTHAVDRKDGKHIPYRKPSHMVGKKFPRAQFGLPIVFKFKKEDEDNGDPRKTTLKVEGRNRSRLSSPLILRPIACANGEYIGIALILETPSLPDVELEGYGTVVTDLVAGDIAHIAPMHNTDPSETDVLKSFLKTIK